MNKFCRTCKETLPLEDFVKSKSGKDGTLNICKPCKARQSREYLKGNYKKITERRYEVINSSVEERLKHITYVAKNRAKKKGHVFTLSYPFIHAMWSKQEGKCALSGVEMGIQTRTDELVSIDRIDSSIGYTGNNVQLVAHAVNISKNILPQDYFINMCKHVADRNK